MSIPLKPPVVLKNQDLLRASLYTLHPKTVAQALRWFRGENVLAYPISIHFNLTLRCTAQCIHCKQWTWPNQKELSIKRIEELFSIFKSWGVRTITLGGGNPLIHPSICTVLRLAHENAFQIGIISEGINMNDQLADAICQYVNWIRFSLDGPRSYIHDKIRNKEGLWDLVIDSIKLLKSRRTALSVGLNCLVQKNNIGFLPEMIDLGQQIGVDLLLFKIPHGNDPMGNYLPSHKQWIEFIKWINQSARFKISGLQTNLSQLRSLIDSVFHVADILQGKPVKSFYLQEKILCFAPMFFLTCDSKGNMFPCDYLQADTRLWGGRYKKMRREFSLGNVLDNSQIVIENLNKMLRNRILELPLNGYDECGCCTRFCQLNASLTHLHRQLQDSPIDEEYLINVLGSKLYHQKNSEFL